jgi:hypothetical protein
LLACRVALAQTVAPDALARLDGLLISVARYSAMRWLSRNVSTRPAVTVDSDGRPQSGVPRHLAGVACAAAVRRLDTHRERP